MKTYIALFIDGEYKIIVSVMAVDYESAEIKLALAGWDNPAWIEPIEKEVQVIKQLL